MTRGPWSIKGIDSKARQAARERAHQDGLTLGEYLNRLLMDDGEMSIPVDQDDDPAEHFLDAAHEADTLASRLRASPRQSGATAPQTKPRLQQSLQNILERLEANERGHSTLAGRVDGAMHDLEASQSALRTQVETMGRKDTSRRTLDAMRALEGALSRLAREVHETHEKVNTEQQSLREQVESGVDRIQTEVDAVNKRVDDTLSDAADRVERAVENAELRSEGVGRHLAQRMSEVEGLISDSQSRVNDTVEQIADSAGRLADFQKRADERVSQALDRSESALDAVSRHTKQVDDRLDATEKSAQGAAQMATDAIQKLDTHDKELRQRLKSLANMTDSKLEQVYTVAEEALETAVARSDALDDKLEKRLGEADAGMRKALEDAMRKTEDLDRKVDTVAAKSASAGDSIARIDAFDKRLDEAVQAVGRADDRNKDLADRLFSKVDTLEGKLSEDRDANARRMDSTQQNVTAMMGRLNEADASIARAETRSADALETLRAAMSRIDERLDKAEKSSDRVNALETSVETFDARLADTERKSDEVASALRDDFQQQVDTLTETLTRSLQDTRDDLEQKLTDTAATVEDAASTAAISQMEERLEAMQAQIAQNESRQAEAVEIISDQFERMSKVLEQRLEALKSDTDTATAQAVRDEVAQLSSELDARISTVENADQSAALETMASEVSRLAEKLDEKVRQSEHRSAEAIEQVGEQVIRATERIQASQDKALDQINDRLERAAEDTAERLNAVTEDVSRRLDSIGEDSKTAVKPVENTVASLARRLEAIEDLDVGAAPPPFVEDGMTSQVDLDDDENAPPFAALLDEMSPDAPKAQTPDALDIEDEDDDDLDAAGIAASAHSARREFAAHLAAHKDDDDLLEDDAEDLLDAEALDDQADALTDDEDDNADSDLFSPSVDAGAAQFGAARTAVEPEPEYEAELPPTPDHSLLADELRADVGADDDPFGRASLNNLEFLKAARQAALERGGDNRSTLGATEEPEKRSSRMPLVAASALAIAVAGGAGLMIMRGKQGNADESFATLPATAGQDTTSTAGAGASVGADSSALEDDLFDAAEGDVSPVEEAKVDEDLLFPEDARILTAENLDAQAAAAPVATPPAPAATPVSAGPRKVSAMEAFASRPSAPPKVTLESAAASGDPAALFELGTKRFNDGDKRGAAELMQRAADLGSAIAQYRLAKLYEKGEGVPRSVKESRRWTQSAADAGNVKAMHDLAVFYAEGEGGGPQSYVAAVEWFTKAANSGLLDSQYNLGVLYEQGLGVTANPAEAAVWFEIAGKNGDADGARRARDLMQRLSPAEADTARIRARAFSPMPTDAAANGQTGAKSWEAAPSVLPAQVREVQRLLNLLNYDAGTPDGLMGSRTRAAIRSYESSRNMPVTGEVSPSLINALRSQSIGANG